MVVPNQGARGFEKAKTVNSFSQSSDYNDGTNSLMCF
jgi:hypothetical protein